MKINHMIVCLGVVLCFAIQDAAANAISFLDVPTQQVSSLSLSNTEGNVTVNITALNGSSNADVNILTANGLGVGTDSMVDVGETLYFIFTDPVQNVSYEINRTSSSMQDVPHNRLIQVISPGGLSEPLLGTFNQSDVDSETNISALVNNVPIGGFIMTNVAFSDSENAFGLSAIHATSVPEPSTLAIAGLAGLSCLLMRGFRRKQMRPA